MAHENLGPEGFELSPVVPNAPTQERRWTHQIPIIREKMTFDERIKEKIVFCIPKPPTTISVAPEAK